MSPAPRFRSRTFYRIVLALPVAALVGLLATGRLQAYFRIFALKGQVPPSDFQAGWVTGLIWIAAVTPLVLAAWEIGRHHTAARRLQTDWLVGFRMVIRLALGDDMPPQVLADFDRPARDNPTKALVWGASIALLVPIFFAGFLPELRTPMGLTWLLGAGILMGATTYGYRRAAAYVIDEPGPWDLFRQFRLLSSRRYHPAGRKFVRIQIAATILLPLWWLGGGALILFR